MTTRNARPTAPPTFDEVLAALQTAGKEPKRSGSRGKEQYAAFCPAHDDQRNRSLSLTRGDGDPDKAVLYCHAGCTYDAIIGALGLASWQRQEPRPTRSNTSSVGSDKKGGKQKRDRGHIVATYGYRDEVSTLLSQTVRFDPKNFLQRRPDGHGGWIWNLDGVRRVPYRLPELLTADPTEPVYFVEGEKDVERLVSIGLVATTTAQGADSWDKSADAARAALTDRHVVILPDADEPGRKYAKQVATDLYGHVASVRVIHLPGLDYVKNHGQDVSDWLSIPGNTGASLTELVNNTPEWQPGQEKQQEEPASIPGIISARDLAAKTFEPPVWIVPDLIPTGLTVLSGKPKMGKSWLLLALAVARTSGGKFLGSVDMEVGPVLYLALEDTEESLQERLRTVLHGAPVPDGLDFATASTADGWRMNGDGVAYMDQWLAEHPCGTIILDTLAKVIPPRRANANAYTEDYAVGVQLKQIADTRRGSIIAVTHNRKSSADDPFDEINASTGLAGSFDTGLVMRRERGAADAVLYAAGRRLRDRELALKFDQEICLWSLMGDAADYAKSEQRRQIIDAVRELSAGLDDMGKPAGGATPKTVADWLADATGKSNYHTVKNLMAKMVASGELKALGSGKYAVVSVVSVVSGALAPENNGTRRDYGAVVPRSPNHSFVVPNVVSNLQDTLFGTTETTETTQTTQTTETTQQQQHTHTLPPPPSRECYRCGQRCWQWNGERWNAGCLATSPGADVAEMALAGVPGRNGHTPAAARGAREKG